MFQSHLGADAVMTQVVSDGVIRTLNNTAQSIPTNGVQPLATTGSTPLPTTPASPISYNTLQPLVVMGSRAMVQDEPMPEPTFYEKNKKVIWGGVVVLGLLAVLKAKR